MRILITGGAGYIGSHVVKALGKLGHDLTIVDNLSTGFAKAVTFGKLIVADLSDRPKMEEVFAAGKFEAVLHFAGSIIVPASVSEPLNYYQNNTLNSHALMSLCAKHGVKNFIFSSTAVVYAMTPEGVFREDSHLAPISPYGTSKLMTEYMLRDLAIANKNFRYIALRYFNVSGADPDGQLGQSFLKATHLIKAASEVVTGKKSSLDIYGTDYPTPDGTGVRDYIHVTDLAEAHVNALEYLANGGESQSLNCGYGRGFSVREVISRVKVVTGNNFDVFEKPRRPGDPPCLVSNAEKIRQLTGWKPKYDDLDVIIKSAVAWEKNRTY